MLRRALIGLTVVVACSSATTDPQLANDGPPIAGDPGGTIANVPEPTGPELVNVDPSALTLAPGRSAWLGVSAYIRTSLSSMTAVTPRVSVASSDASVASIAADTGAWWRVTARRAGVATITVRSERAGNTTKQATITVRAAPMGDESGLVYSAIASVRPTSTNAPSVERGPSDLDVRVVIANPTSATRDIWLSGCGAWVGVYRTAVEASRAIPDVPRGVQCMAGERHVVLAPGRADTVQGGGVRLDIGSDTLGTGRYHVVASLDRIRDLLPIQAGTVDIVSPNAGLVFGATTSASGDSVRVRATLRNANAEPVRLEYGACAVTLLAYRTAERTGTPAWNSDYRTPWNVPGAYYGCPEYLAVGIIRPGETLSPRELNPTFPVREVLGDSLPNARYWFRARIRMNWRTTIVDAADAVVSR